MNKEIEIPEGYEARIEGNKVIIGLKESEDERIKKGLIQHLKELRNWKVGTEAPIKVATHYDAWIAYLERIKEQKPSYINFISDWLRKHIKTYVNSEYNEFHKTVEYDGSINIEHLIEDLKNAIEQQFFAHENDFVSKPAEWSEEDESYLQTVIGEMEASKKEALEYEHKIYDAIILWLKSLPEKFNLQPKQEWSKVDYLIFDSILSVVEEWESNQSEKEKEYYGATTKSDWLKTKFKSLRPRPQSHWKPSEEQMEALSYVKEYFKDIPSAKKKYIFLVQLYDNIQKLL